MLPLPNMAPFLPGMAPSLPGMAPSLPDIALSLPGIAPLVQSIEHCGKAKTSLIIRLKDLTNVQVGCKLDISLTWPVYVAADDVPRPSGHILP